METAMGRMERREVGTEGEGSLDPALSQRDRGVLAMVRKALERGDTTLAYQPVIRSATGEVDFYEGLIRILDETGRVIPAKEFITVAEEQDLGRQIDCAALRVGLNALKNNPGLRLSINMSARSVGYPGWMQILQRNLRQNPEALTRLILEITETSVMQMPDIVAYFMEDLQAHGVTFALDDFGAGYTAFRHLRTFSFDILKIDGQFARNVEEDADNQVLTEALIFLARHFEMAVVAEAVETQAEADWLTAAGVDCLQGYFFGAPTMTPPWAGNKPAPVKARRGLRS